MENKTFTYKKAKKYLKSRGMWKEIKSKITNPYVIIQKALEIKETTNSYKTPLYLIHSRSFALLTKSHYLVNEYLEKPIILSENKFEFKENNL